MRCSTNSLPVQCHQKTDGQTPMHCHVQDSETHIPCSGETALEPCHTEAHKHSFDSTEIGTANELNKVSGDSDKKSKVVDDDLALEIVENGTETQSHTRSFDAEGENFAAAAEQNSLGSKIACANDEHSFSCMPKQVTTRVAFISALYQRVFPLQRFH